MSGAQGAHPPGEMTPTTYESVEGGLNRTKTDLRSREDEGPIQIEKVQDKVDHPVGKVDPLFSTAGTAREQQQDDKKDDLGVTGTA